MSSLATKAELVAALALSSCWCLPSQAAFLNPPSKHHHHHPVLVHQGSGRSHLVLPTREQQPSGCGGGGTQLRSAGVAGLEERKGGAAAETLPALLHEGTSPPLRVSSSSPLFPLSLPSLSPDDIHDSILETYVQPHLVSKSYQPRPPAPPPLPPDPPRNKTSNETPRRQQQQQQLEPQHIPVQKKEVVGAQPQPIQQAVQQQQRQQQKGQSPQQQQVQPSGGRGSWWGKDMWGSLLWRGGNKHQQQPEVQDKGKGTVAGSRGVVSKEAAAAAVALKKKKRRMKGADHHVRDGLRKLLRHKQDEGPGMTRQAMAKQSSTTTTKVRPTGSSSTRSRRPPPPPPSPPPPAWASLTSRIIKRVAESPSVTWVANRFRPSPGVASTKPKQSWLSSTAPLLQRVMDPRSMLPSASSFQQQRGRELRPDDLLKLPRNVEEAWDTFTDDVRHFCTSLCKAIVPDPSKLEPPPVRPRVGLERPKAQLQRSGPLNAMPLALRQQSVRGRQAAAALVEKGKSVAIKVIEDSLGGDKQGRAAGGEDAGSGAAVDSEEEEEVVDVADEDWVAKVQLSLDAMPSDEAATAVAGRNEWLQEEEEEEEESIRDDDDEQGGNGFVRRYPLALPTPPLAPSGDEDRTESEVREMEEAMARANAAAVEPTADAVTYVVTEDLSPPESPSSSPPSSPRRAVLVPAKQKSWLDNVLGKILANPDRLKETQRRRQLIKRVPRRMDERFLRTVSRKLQGDRLRIREFQLQTDRFRNSLISVQAYYDSVVVLFGSVENGEEVLVPLIDTLPEQSKRRDLADVCKARRQRGGAGAQQQPSQERDDEDEEEGEQQVGGFRATVGGWLSAGAGWTRNAVSTVVSLAANRTLEISFETEEGGDEEGGEKGSRRRGARRRGGEPSMEVLLIPPDDGEPFARAREMLGERNLEYLQMRIDTFKRGGITAADFYRSLQRLCGPAARVDVVMKELERELKTTAPRPWTLLEQVHEGQTRVNNQGTG